jgi:exopolyphosphatase/guanosine-5'-triphosphate,3'-diphosphate pyrophosphatase
MVAETAGAFVTRDRRQGAGEILLVATHAVRSAANRAAVIRAVEAATSRAVRLLDPHTEACLAALGAATGGPWPVPTLAVDVGGGSVQLALARRGAVVSTASIAGGSGSLGLVLGDSRAGPHDLEPVRLAVACEVERAVREAGVPPGCHIVATGGAVRRLVRLAGGPGGSLSLDAIEVTAARLAGADGQADAVARGIAARRLPIVEAGALLLARVLRSAGAGSATFSASGLREGAIVAASPGPLPLRIEAPGSNGAVSAAMVSPVQLRLPAAAHAG